MKKIILSILIIGSALELIAQTKGASPIAVISDKASVLGSTYAVVVGISDYQDPAIPDLRFADKDAEAFANYLRSNAGGKLGNDHLKVLLNDKATAAQFAIALDWLMEVVKENDQVILYFSGHGDVERKTITQPGYLLCWDAPSRVYLAGGALALPMFQDIISTLSTQNKAKVIVITDACRSGKLAGSSVGGSQITGANLAKQYANEIKILSCQPNEYSIEGEQWGGGRGAFSYNLVNALYGMADQNNDLIVNLQEAGRYLEDHVTAEVAPISQLPMILGNRSETLSNVDALLLAGLKSGKSNQQTMLSLIDARGIEEDVLAVLDTSVRNKYKLFKQSLKDKNFLPVPTKAGEPRNACSDSYYEQLIKEPKLGRLHSNMTRNYAAALQDDAQQTLNKFLKTNIDLSLDVVVNKLLPQKVFTEKVKSYPRCLDRAAELLGSKHYMFATLKARQYFFEGYLLANSNQNPNIELGERALALFRKSLQWQPEQPQVYWQMSRVFSYNFRQPDSLEQYAWRAIEIHPNWILVCNDAAFLLSDMFKLQERARPFLELASQIDSNSPAVFLHWAAFNICEKNFPKAEDQIKKAIALDPTLVEAWNSLGYLYRLNHRHDEAEIAYKKALVLDSTYVLAWYNLGTLYKRTNRNNEAELYLKKTIALDSTYCSAWNNLGAVYNGTRRYAEAEPIIKKSISLDSTQTSFWNNLGYLYLQTRRYTEAEQVLKKSIELDSNQTDALNNLGYLYTVTRRYAEAEPVLKKAIGLDSTNVIFWNSLGYLYNQAQQYVAAESALKIAVAFDSTNNTSWTYLGITYFNTSRYAEAEANFIKALALDSTNATTHYQLGRTFLKTKRMDDAVREYLKVLTLNPNAILARLSLASIRFAESKTAEAISYIEQAISKSATFDQLEKDEDLAPLRALSEWKELMKKHFPDKFKD